MTASSTSTAPTASDRVRQVVVALGAAVAIAGAAWGAGAFGGTPIQEAAGGALAADATVLAPASAAFGIWSVIYTGLTAFAVFQALPSRGADPRLRAVAWLVLASMFLNAAWIAVVQAGWLWASVVVIALLAAVLGLTARRLAAVPPAGWAQRLCVDVPVGLYLGWVAVATVADVTATLAASMPNHEASDGAGVAAGVLIVVAALAVVFARALRRSTWLAAATCLAMSWGLWWIAVGRLTDEPRSLIAGWFAGLAAAVAFGAPFAVRDFSMIGKKDPLAPE